MKSKYLLGIGLPLVVLLFVFMIGIFNIGLAIIESSPQSISRTDFVLENNTHYIVGPAVVEITIKNQFFMQRIIPINYVICSKQPLSPYGSKDLQYRIYTNNEKSSDTYSYSRPTEIYVNPDETKKIEIIPVFYQSTYDSDINYYNNVTELLVFKINSGNDFNSDSCVKLIAEKSNQAISIKVVN